MHRTLKSYFFRIKPPKSLLPIVPHHLPTTFLARIQEAVDRSSFYRWNCSLGSLVLVLIPPPPSFFLFFTSSYPICNWSPVHCNNHWLFVKWANMSCCFCRSMVSQHLNQGTGNLNVFLILFPLAHLYNFHLLVARKKSLLWLIVAVRTQFNLKAVEQELVRQDVTIATSLPPSIELCVLII